MKHSSLTSSTPLHFGKESKLSLHSIFRASITHHSSFIIAASAILLLATSCRKTCTCIEMNGLGHTYTREEVIEANGGNCEDMIYQFTGDASGTLLQFYAVCSWD